MENSSAKRHYYQAYEMRHALSDIDVRLTALERGEETVDPNEIKISPLTPNKSYVAQNVSSKPAPTPVLPEMEITEFLTPKPDIVNTRLDAPAPATVETAPTMSEKAATDEQVEEIQLSYAHFNKIEIEDLAALCIRINSDRARIDALKAESDRLRRQVEDLLGCKFQPIDWPRARRIYAQFKERYPDSASKETI